MGRLGMLGKALDDAQRVVLSGLGGALMAGGIAWASVVSISASYSLALRLLPPVAMFGVGALLFALAFLGGSNPRQKLLDRAIEDGKAITRLDEFSRAHQWSLWEGSDGYSTARGHRASSRIRLRRSGRFKRRRPQPKGSDRRSGTLTRAWQVTGSTLPGHFREGEPSPDRHAQNGLESTEIAAVAQVVGEHALIEVAEQMERLDAHVGAVQPALEQAPEVLQPVDVDLAVDVLDGVIDGLMAVGALKADVADVLVGVQARAVLNVLFDMPLDAGPFAVGDDFGANLAAALEGTGNHCLILAAGPRDLSGFDGFVHVPGLAADVGLIDLDGAAQLLEAAGLHGEPDSVQHEPRRLLRDPERPPQLVGADSILGVGDEPDGRKPLVQPERGILEDRPELDRVLLLAGFALPKTARRQVAVLDAATARADRTIGPAQVGDELRADIEVGEVADRLDQIGGLL